MLLTRKQLYARARKIKLLIMDVDGVMTDGKIYFIHRADGSFYETKSFHSRDGMGIRYAHQAGLQTGIITGRGSPVIEHRVKELGIHHLVQNRRDKLEPYQEIRRAAKVRDEEVCYIGDDVVDLPLLKRVGLAVAVGDAHPLIRPHVHYVTKLAGGLGALRETVELILTAQGKWAAIMKEYLA
jgi:3-deoxy-D-manno-octulosonate 8-phosphate phosphatase (KDO 8-P phosphatase)